LTGLYNRRGFLTLAEQQMKTASRFQRGLVLLFADLDRMKWINDNLGHPEGDRALTAIAGILKATFRESDIVARWGGDEFVVLAAETSEDSADMVTGRLVDHLAAANRPSQRGYQLSLSVGTARYDPGLPCSIDELLAHADQSMYAQKRARRASAAPEGPR
jgi:two-component system, cell cycle response regulator